MASVREFAAKVKAKYPEYAHVDDLELATRMVEKYPEYRDRVEFEPAGALEKPAGLKPQAQLPRMMGEGINQRLALPGEISAPPKPAISDEEHAARWQEFGGRTSNAPSLDLTAPAQSTRVLPPSEDPTLGDVVTGAAKGLARAGSLGFYQPELSAKEEPFATVGDMAGYFGAGAGAAVLSGLFPPAAPAIIGGMGAVSTLRAGNDLKAQGYDMTDPKALAGATAQGFFDAATMPLPGAFGGGRAVRIATGAGLGAGQGVAGEALQAGILEREGEYGTAALLGGALGAGAGALGRLPDKPLQQTAERPPVLWELMTSSGYFGRHALPMLEGIIGGKTAPQPAPKAQNLTPEPHPAGEEAALFERAREYLRSENPDATDDDVHAFLDRRDAFQRQLTTVLGPEKGKAVQELAERMAGPRLYNEPRDGSGPGLDVNIDNPLANGFSSRKYEQAFRHLTKSDGTEPTQADVLAFLTELGADPVPEKRKNRVTDAMSKANREAKTQEFEFMDRTLRGGDEGLESLPAGDVKEHFTLGGETIKRVATKDPGIARFKDKHGHTYDFSLTEPIYRDPKGKPPEAPIVEATRPAEPFVNESGTLIGEDGQELFQSFGGKPFRDLNRQGSEVSQRADDRFRDITEANKFQPQAEPFGAGAPPRMAAEAPAQGPQLMDEDGQLYQKDEEPAFDPPETAGLPDTQKNDPKLQEIAAREWREKGTESQFFKRWFGDSKVRDAEGKPLRVFHGTVGDFSSFAPDRLGQATGSQSARQGFFFASDPITAADYTSIGGDRATVEAERAVQAARKATDDLMTEYRKKTNGLDPQEAGPYFSIYRPRLDAAWDKVRAAEQRLEDARKKQQSGGSFNNWETAAEGANVMPVYLQMENPLELDYGGSKFREVSFSDAMAQAKEAGHDGVIFRNARDNIYDSHDSPADIYAVFSPEQIKSATGNRGTFNAEDPNILYQDGTRRQGGKPKAWDEVQTGDDFSHAKKFIPPDMEEPKQLSSAKVSTEMAEEVRQLLMVRPEVTAADGRLIRMAVPEGKGADGLLRRAKHLLLRRSPGMGTAPRTISTETKSRWAAAMWDTLENAHVAVKSHGNVIYFRRYKSGLHAVIVDPRGTVQGQAVFKGDLITQFAPEKNESFSGARILWKRGDASNQRGLTGEGEQNSTLRPTHPDARQALGATGGGPDAKRMENNLPPESGPVNPPLKSGAKGSFRIRPEDGQAVMTLAKGKADVSTVAHELFHYVEQTDILTPEDRQALIPSIAKAGKMDPGQILNDRGVFTKEAAELTARWFERYLRDGSAPTPELQNLFARIKRWMVEVYQSLKGSSIAKDVPPEVRAVYDRIFRFEPFDAPKAAEAPPGSRRRGFSDTLAEQGLPEGNKPYYEPQSHTETQENTDRLFREKGADEVYRMVRDAGEPSAEQTAAGIRLIKRFQDDADKAKTEEARREALDKAVNLATTMAERLTKMGQAIEAVKMVESLSPDGIVFFAERQLAKINERLGESKKRNLTAAEAEQLRNLAKNAQKFQVYTDEARALALVADKIQTKQKLTPEDERTLREWSRKTAPLLGRTQRPVQPGRRTTQEQLEEFLSGRAGEAMARLQARGIKPKGEVLYQDAETAGLPDTQKNDPKLQEIAAREWREKGTESQFFKRWFGGSKILDPDEKPKVVYHGTKADFSEFDPSKIGSATDSGELGAGFYFSSDPKVVRDDEVGMPVYLAVKNPLRLEMPNWKTDKRSLISRALGSEQPLDSKEIQQRLQSKGYDGVTLDYSPAGYFHQEIAVFSPNQIKSATGNRGTFGPTDPNILYQDGLSEQDIDDLAEIFAAKIAKRPQGGALTVRNEMVQGFGLEKADLKKVEARGLRAMSEARTKYVQMAGITAKINELIANLDPYSPDAMAKASQIRQMVDTFRNLTGDAKIEAGIELNLALRSLEPEGGLRKVETAQTVAQLLNPKTLVRNIIGNEAFYRLERVQKWVATPIDIARSALTGKDRTVTFKTNNQGEYWRNWMVGWKAGWKGVSPMGIETQFDIGAPAFRDKRNPLYWMEKALGASLRSFDFAAYMRAKNETLGELATLDAMKRGLKGDALKADVKRRLLQMDENLQRIADEYGRYVTFQDDNFLSNTARGIKRALNAGQEFGIGSLVLKYPKTPANLFMRAMEYSPAGFIRSAYQIAEPLHRGLKPDSREALLALSRAITGTLGTTGMGYLLAEAGVLTGSYEKDRDMRRFKEEQTGEKNNQVNVSAVARFVASGFDPKALTKRAGDKLVSYDWLQPMAIGLSMGAQMQKAVKGEATAGSVLGAAGASVAGAAETIFEQPLLKGVQDLMGSPYDKDKLAGLGNIAMGAPASFVPTALNQMRQATDNVARETYDPANPFQTALNKVINKLPGLSKTLPAQVKTLGGEKEVYQDGGNNAFNVFLNPAFIRTYHVDPMVELLLRPYELAGAKKQFPFATGRILRYNDRGQEKKHKLTGKEMGELQQITAQETKEALSDVKLEKIAKKAPIHQAQELASRVSKSANRARRKFLTGKGLLDKGADEQEIILE